MTAYGIEIPSNLTTNFQPSLFALAADFRDAACEINHVGTYRCQVLGSRRVMATKTEDLMNYLQQLRPTSAELVTLKEAQTWLKTTNIDVSKEVRNKLGGVFCELHCGDTLYMPPGWMFVEAAGNSQDLVGVRLQVLRVKDLQPMEKLEELLRKRGKPNETLKTICDKIVMAS